MYLKNFLTALLVFTFISLPAAAQQTSFQLQDSSTLRVDGDSNVRTWGADAETISGSLTLNSAGDLSLEALTPQNFESLELSVLVEDLDSGTRGLTRNMHDYLNSDDHPEITFILQEVTDITTEGSQASIVAKGVINAAGADHQVTLNTVAEITSNNTLRFTGEHEMLMSDFGIDPPTAVFGTVRSADEIVITFNVIFSN